MNERLRTILSNSAGYLAVAAVSVVYILAGLFVPGLKDKSLATVLAEGITGFILGVAINFNLSLQGILKGKDSEQMKATRAEHGKAVERIVPMMDRLDPWCAAQNAQKLQEKRQRILRAAALRYEDYFDQEGNMIAPSPLTDRRQKRVLRRALRARITPLSPAALTCDGERQEDPFDFGETPEQYQRRTALTDAVTKVLMAVVFGYFGVTMVESFDVATLVWRALYVALLLALGVSKMLRSYLFVADTYRSNLIKKINHLQAFESAQGRRKE